MTLVAVHQKHGHFVEYLAAVKINIFIFQKVTGYGTVYATQSPGDCVAGQNETYVTSPGGALVLTASGTFSWYFLCMDT